VSDALIDHLERLRDRQDRAALSALRRGLSGDPAGQSRMHPHVVPFLPKNWQRQEDYYLVASLFALHPTPGGQGTLGSVLAQVQRASGSGSTENRVVALLESHREDVPQHLRHAVDLARSKGVAIDWRRLLKDLAGWDHPDQYVQRAWARDFWTPFAEETDTEGVSP